MVKANVRNAMGVYVGLIDEVDNGFRIVWNGNPVTGPDDGRPDGSTVFPDYEAACAAVHSVLAGARISKTINFRFLPGRQG